MCVCVCAGGVDDVEEYRRTALMYAAMADRWECVQLLLKHSALISARDNNGQTALHWAAATVGDYKTPLHPSPLPSHHRTAIRASSCCWRRPRISLSLTTMAGTDTASPVRLAANPAPSQDGTSPSNQPPRLQVPRGHCETTQASQPQPARQREGLSLCVCVCVCSSL